MAFIQECIFFRGGGSNDACFLLFDTCTPKIHLFSPKNHLFTQNQFQALGGGGEEEIIFLDDNDNNNGKETEHFNIIFPNLKF